MHWTSKLLFILALFVVPQFAFAWTEVTRTTKTIGSSGSWTDIDVSAIVPVGATGVCGEMRVNSGSRTIGARKNGSTDNRTNALDDSSHTWFCIGVDANPIFEGFCGDAAQCSWDIEAYTTDDAIFNTNATDKSLGSTAAWTDIDISADTTGTAVGAVIEAVGSTADQTFGLRKNGSTDNRTNLLALNFMHQFGIVGVDGSEILEGFIGSTNTDFFLVGYFISNFTALTNATDKSLGSTASYVDLTASPAGAVGTAVEVISTGDTNFNIRKKGAANDNYWSVNRHTWAFVPVNASQLSEGKISATTVDFFETGYFTATAQTCVTWNSSDKSVNITLSNSDLTATAAAAGSWQAVRSSGAIPSGKYYWELTILAVDANRDMEVGIATAAANLNQGDFSNQTTAWIYYGFNGKKGTNGSFTAYGDSYTVGDIVGVALDMDNGKVFFSKNGTWQASGDPAAGTNAAYSTGLTNTMYPAVAFNQGSQSVRANFGGSAFTYTAPSGFTSFSCGGATPVATPNNNVIHFE